MMSNIKSFSAPGKALLAGGYLVLDPQYASYVVALSARMHAVVQFKDSNDCSKFKVSVTSEQFNGDRWDFEVDPENGYMTVNVNARKNPFLNFVLINVFSYFRPQAGNCKEISIQIYSDAEYHSQNDSTVKKNEYKKFNFHSQSITEVPKTGLGSSAGLVTVVTAALVSVFKPDLDVASMVDLKLIHNLAQVAHCQAQGKVGSGFDVAAATFGSILYQRFSPELITNLPTYSTESALCYQEHLVKLIDETDWNYRNDRISLPQGLRLFMGDVNSGSETVKLVAKVKQWYKENEPRSLHIYQKINQGNLKFIESLNKLNQLSKNDISYYDKIVKAVQLSVGIESFPELVDVQNAIYDIRENFRLITQESGADIEPPVQKKLLDACLTQKGVLTGMIPGAGGYDAIVLITSTECQIESDTVGNPEFASVNWLDLTQADIGIVQENPNQYSNLK